MANLKGIKKGDTIKWTKSGINILNLHHNNPTGVKFDKLDRLCVIDIDNTCVKLPISLNGKDWFNNYYIQLGK